MARNLLLLAFTSLAAWVIPHSAWAEDPPALTVKSVSFTSTPAPSNEFEMVVPYTRSEAVVALADGTIKRFPMSWEVLHRSGDYLSGWYAGLIVDRTGQPIGRTVPDDEGNAAQGPFFSPGADGVSMLALPSAAVAGVKGHTLFLINHLEYETAAANVNPEKGPVDPYGRLPMAMNLTVLDQDPQTGRLTPIRLSNVDFSTVDGLWNPCNASITPWMSHLGGEEYEPDAAYFEKQPLEAMNLYRGTTGKLAKDGGAKPYQYGHIVEISVGPDGGTAVTKHFAMGRLSFELADVMADGKTAYIGDDGDDVIRAMFVADTVGDLSAGTLYAAKWRQRAGDPFGSAGLEWIRLGHATDAEIKALIDRGVAFSDIFEAASPAEVKADPAKFSDFRPVYAYPGAG